MNIITAIFSNTLVAFLLLICIIVVIHELGHFLVGRLLGIGVEEFSVGFGPKALSFKWGETVYRLNWFPLGGYVRFYGADTTAKISEKDRERSILHAKLYKRMLVAVAGPFANFILSLFIMLGLYSYGVTKFPAVFKVMPDSVAYQDGLRSNDKVLSIDRKEIADWGALTQTIAASADKKLELKIERNAQIQTLIVTPKADNAEDMFGEMQKIGRIGITPFFSAARIAPVKGQIFSEIGLNSNDTIVSLNNQKIEYLSQFLSYFEAQTKSTSDAELAKAIQQKRISPFTIEVQNEAQISKTLDVNFTSARFQKWAKKTLSQKNDLTKLSWSKSVSAAELTLESYNDVSKENPLYTAEQSLKGCGLKSGDTIRRIDDSKLFTSQIDFYSWVENKTQSINKNLNQFKNNSVPVNITATNQTGIQSQYACYLPIRNDKDKLSHEKLFIDFPVKFAAKPVTYPATKMSGKNLWENIALASKSVVKQTTFIYEGFKRLFSGSVPLSALGGPIAIAGFAGDAAKAGIETFLLAMSLMSVNIGIFNLLPLPALDGGMLLLQFVELFYRKPLPEKVQLLIARIGISFLLTLFILVFYNDIARLF